MMEESRASKKDYNNILNIETTIETDLNDLPNHNPQYIFISIFADVYIYVDFGRKLSIELRKIPICR